MFIFKIIFCVLIFSGYVCARRCFDCVSLSSCDSAADYAKRVQEGDTGVSNATFQKAVCGFEGEAPKVCCSAFPEIQTNVVYQDRGGTPETSLRVSRPRSCFDCVPISSCDSAAKYAEKIAQGGDTGASNASFQSAVCGYEGDSPKVCCSAFPEIQTNVVYQDRGDTPETSLRASKPRSCFDCVPISSCDSAAKYAEKIALGGDTGASNATFQSAVCGYEGDSPKVCCSAFPESQIDSRSGDVLATTNTPPPPTSRAPVSRTCPDCISLDSCLPALDYIQRSEQETSGVKHEKLKKAFCGFKGFGPQVCCSEFGNENETHPNVRLLPTTCGEVDGRKIINGGVAGLYELPWMALLAHEHSYGTSFGCAGSIINSRYILTAAHCVINLNTRKLKRITEVHIGDINLSTQYDCQGVGRDRICETSIQNISVEEIIPHENFSREPFKVNDIALLRLSKPINYTTNARPVCLPVSSKLRSASLADQDAIVAGWGLTENQSQSDVLLKIKIPIWSSESCQRSCHSRSSNDFRKICAGGQTQDSCTGDSGGPLIVDSSYNGVRSYVQYGIISYGPKPCAAINRPGVYTDVSKYMQWILDHIKE